MKKSIQICNIKIITKNGKEQLKFPKLSELHNMLFGSIPNKLHNSLNDVLICLRCYYIINYNQDLIIIDREINNLIQELL